MTEQSEEYTESGGFLEQLTIDNDNKDQSEELTESDGDLEDSIEDSIEIQDQIEKLKEEKKEKIRQDLNDDYANQNGKYIEGQIKKVEKIKKKFGSPDAKITLSFIHQNEKKTKTIRLKIPQEPEDYNSDMELVRLINYLDVDDRQSLVGRYVPLERTETDNFELDIPSNSFSDKIGNKFRRKLTTKTKNVLYGLLSIIFISLLGSLTMQALTDPNLTGVGFTSIYIMATMIGSFIFGVPHIILKDIGGKNITDSIYALFSVCFALYFIAQPQTFMDLANSMGNNVAVFFSVIYFNSMTILAYMSYNSYKKIKTKSIKKTLNKYKMKVEMMVKGAEDVEI